jgi:hypothetical protein
MAPQNSSAIFASVEISTRAPWITLNEQHIMACTSTMPNVLGCKIPHELDALKWKTIGRRRRKRYLRIVFTALATVHIGRNFVISLGASPQ